MAKSKTKAEEALQFLDDLDNLNAAPPPSSGSIPPKSAKAATSANPNSRPSDDAGDVLKFIDEITLKSSEPTAPLERPSSRASLATGGTPQASVGRRTTERLRVGSPAPPPPSSSSGTGGSSTPARATTPATERAGESEAQKGAAAGGGWGWGSVWSSASAALQQARTAVDEGVKHLPSNEQAMKWREEVLSRVPFDKEQLGKLGSDLRSKGYSTFTEILNVVAPPISEHEVIQVWSSHDMEGYEGVESLIYKALARVMEQVEGGDLIVNKGHEFKPRENSSEKNLNAVEGIETAFRLAEANVEELFKSNPQSEKKKPTNSQVPTTYSSIYLRLQPFFTSLPRPTATSTSPSQSKQTHLQFVLFLSDPEHQLTHSTVTQAVPAKWVEHMETQDWIEDVIVEVLRTGLETIGQEYIAMRMHWLESEEDAKEKVEAAASEKREETK